MSQEGPERRLQGLLQNSVLVYANWAAMVLHTALIPIRGRGRIAQRAAPAVRRSMPGTRNAAEKPKVDASKPPPTGPTAKPAATAEDATPKAAP